MTTTTNLSSISVKQLAQRLGESDNVDLIDVRTPAEFQSVHACDARNFPLDRLDPQAILAQRQGQPQDPIYFICKAGNRSRQACAKMIAAGFDNVVNVEGGTEAWANAGLPVEKPARRVLPLDRQVQTTAGLICLTGAVLGAFFNPWFYLLSAMVGFGLTMAGLTGFCPMGILLARMPWNQCKCHGSSCCGK